MKRSKKSDYWVTLRTFDSVISFCQGGGGEAGRFGRGDD